MGANPWQTFRYKRTHTETGKARLAERGFISVTDFLGHLALWNRDTRWHYEPVSYEHVGWSRDLVTVTDCGEA